VAGLSAVALIPRLVLASGSGLWRDEALFLFVARSDSWSAMIEFLQGHESHPPLFYAIMRVWLSLTGTSDAAALALPVVLGVAMVPVIYLVGESLFSARVGFLAALLAALSPALIQFSAQVRPYSLLPLVALLSSFTLIRAVIGGRRRAWAAYVVSTLALVYTHNWGWLVLGAEWIAVAVVTAQRPPGSRSPIARDWIIAQLLIAIGYLPWVTSLVYQVRHAGHAGLALESWGDVAIFLTLATRALLQSTVMSYSAENRAAAVSRWLVVLPLVILGIALVMRRRAARRAGDSLDSSRAPTEPARIALVVLTVAPIVSWILALLLSSRSNMVLPRCLVMLAPSLLLVVAWWLGSRTHTATLPLSRLVIASILLTYVVTDASLVRSRRSNAREVANAVAARTLTSDLVIIAPEWLASSFNRYYSPAVEQIDFPHFGREGAVDLAKLHERTLDPRALGRVRDRIAQARASGRRVWLIMESGYVKDLTVEDSTRALETLDFGQAGQLRANQIRAQLKELYGMPDTSIARSTRMFQYEELRPFLFTPVQ
jgi:uncharacterized membrane protein